MTAPDNMDAWILDESPGRYRRGSIATPSVGPDDVRVRVVASALNHMDIWVTRGLPKPHLPHVPGCDVAGIVESVGEGVATVSVGDEVIINPAVIPMASVLRHGVDASLEDLAIYGEHCWGGHATYAVAPARNVVRRPVNRSWEECAAFPLAYLTAYRMLRRARVTAGSTVLVVGIGSGVSCAALAIAQQMGARVEVTSRSDAKRHEAIGLGAAAAHHTAADRWPVSADVVVESVGPATWEKSVRSLVAGGRLVVCGGTSGSTVEVNLPRLFFKQFEIIGSSMGGYQEFDDVVRLVEMGLPVQVDQVLDVENYPAALERLQNGDQLGKIVLRHPGAPA